MHNHIRIWGVLNPNLAVRMVFPTTEEIFGPVIINNVINNTIIMMIIVESLVNLRGLIDTVWKTLRVGIPEFRLAR